MNRKESIQQLQELVSAWDLNEAELNQTDINAIKYLIKNSLVSEDLTSVYINGYEDGKKAVKEPLIKYLEEEFDRENDLYLDALDRRDNEDRMNCLGYRQAIEDIYKKVKGGKYE